MVTTVTLRVDPSSDRVLRVPLPPDVPPGPLEVVVVITPSWPKTTASDLTGRWQAHFPADFDIDSALQEIRHEWEQEWTETEV